MRQVGRLLHQPFRGLLSVYSRYGLHARQVAYATFYTEGFSSFVASAAAPIATGWSELVPGRDFPPAEDQRLFTAHWRGGLGEATGRDRDLSKALEACPPDFCAQIASSEFKGLAMRKFPLCAWGCSPSSRSFLGGHQAYFLRLAVLTASHRRY